VGSRSRGVDSNGARPSKDERGNNPPSSCCELTFPKFFLLNCIYRREVSWVFMDVPFGRQTSIQTFDALNLQVLMRKDQEEPSKCLLKEHMQSSNPPALKSGSALKILYNNISNNAQSHRCSIMREKLGTRLIAL
jgi:hypothetical protein